MSRDHLTWLFHDDPALLARVRAHHCALDALRAAMPSTLSRRDREPWEPASDTDALLLMLVQETRKLRADITTVRDEITRARLNGAEARLDAAQDERNNVFWHLASSAASSAVALAALLVAALTLLFTVAAVDASFAADAERLIWGVAVLAALPLALEGVGVIDALFRRFRRRCPWHARRDGSEMYRPGAEADAADQR